MNVKRYRAATMRDALEKVKSELGEEALVLGSRNVRSRSFLGFGGKEMVEVRVSTEFASPTANNDTNKPASRRSTFTSLSLADTTPMLPAKPEGRESKGSSTFSALAARAYSEEARSTAVKPAPIKADLNEKFVNDLVIAASTKPTVTPAIETFETAEPAVASSSPTKRDSLLVEIDRLRAEVREVKFTLTNRLTQNLAMGGNFASNIDDSDAAIYDSPYYETYLHLAGIGLTPEIARAAVRAALNSGSQSQNVQELAQIGLVTALPSLIKFGDDPLAQPTDSNILNNKNHVTIALIGPTGVGKTTTIAKLAARAALRERKRVELITLDTYRIAAVEQLRTYAEIIGAGFHVPRSVLELNALIQKFSGQATILIDTIGRSARDLADQLELADFLRSNDDIVKCLAIQATTHPSDATLAIEKFALFGIDQLVITKLDETGRPAAAICTAANARLPLAYLCTGQRVPEDIERATPNSLAAHALQNTASAIAA